MFKKLSGIVIGVIAVVVLTGAALAFDASYVEVTNNVGKKDVVRVSGIEPRSVVSVYSQSGMLLGRKTLSNSATSVNITVMLPTATAGEITVTVQKKGETNLTAAVKGYPAEPVSDTPSAVEITNNVDKKDTIHVDYLEPRDLVTVYSAAIGGKRITSGKVRNNSDEVILSLKQLGKDGGSVWVSVKSVGKHESPREKFDFDAELSSTSFSDDDGSITVTNGVNKKGVIEVTDLEPGDMITVFADQFSTKKLGSAKCAKNRDTVTIKTSLLKEDGDNIWLTIKRFNELPSDRSFYKYDKQDISPDIEADHITVESKRNPSGTNDTLYIDGLEAGDIVKLYKDDKTTSVLLRGAVASNRTDITLSRAEFAKENEPVALYVSITRKNMREGNRVEVKMDSVTASGPFVSDDPSVTVTNNAGIQSTVFVSGLYDGVTVTAYNADTNGKVIGSAKVAAGGNSVTINLTLERTGGSVWLTRRDPGFAESSRTEFTYTAQEISVFDTENLDVYIVNNVGAADTITVSGGIRDGDVIKAYASLTTGTVLGQATCGAQDYSVTITIGQLGKDEGTVFLTITNRGKLESERKPHAYQGELPSADISPSNVTVTNNVNAAPTIEVWGLGSGDAVTVYDAPTGGKTLGKGTVDTFASTIKFNLSSLKAEGGAVYVTRKSAGLNESTRAEVPYGAQKPSTAINAADVEIVNNANMPDVITVKNVAANDIIKVYSSQSASESITEAVALDSTVVLHAEQLGTGSGTVFITVTRYADGEMHSESTRTPVKYAAEQVSQILTSVSFDNRTATSVDLVISGLNTGDIIRLYSDAAGTILLGSATAGSESMTLTLNQLSASSGFVHITRTTQGMHESAKCSYQYGAHTPPAS
ncbi:MAG: hypothetical protein FWH16_03235 [Oscillospiraceae bacterium]|nr:hypothetical protein [Oscillospiraceae bacterium]